MKYYIIVTYYHDIFSKIRSFIDILCCHAIDILQHVTMPIGTPNFWLSLDALIQSTSKKVLANYMAFDVIYHTMLYLPPREYNTIVHDFIDVSRLATGSKRMWA